jgi:hypothetical protein
MTKPAALETKKLTACAMSWGAPKRPAVIKEC